MAEEEQFGPEGQPLPEGGWSGTIVTLENAVVVPPEESSFVQPAGVLDAAGRYCPEGALWRKYRPLTTEPAQPATISDTLPGRWLWGGVLWAHFGHFLVESSSRLWALNEIDQPVDGILFIPKRPAVGDMVRGFQRDFIGQMAPGLPIRVATAPMQVEELVVPGQGFGLGKITAGTQKFRDAIHSRFALDVAPEGPEKLYISRSKLGLGKGGLLGEEQLETLLEAEGYEIFHPQEHDIATQLARYKAAKKVIAADGSALHLFAMVGRPDQPVAMILRRQSGANNLLAGNVAHFCGSTPLVINALRTEWVKSTQKKSNRLSFGEIDHGVLARVLGEKGFVRPGLSWPTLSDAEREQVLKDKGLGGNDDFVESPEYVRRRVRAMREARRARRAEREAGAETAAAQD
ncbi:glycosyltransferase 61 family protein [Pseudodonghicola flavimaris]|uniref:Glycosyltransferase 61 family protein n=1 Tax=Pseudodonghicola flavimaris TaxID=3050036 RepID=A0ABT7EZQ4_9RHOB|nr:glycosyltransferase 61 family protein [Pseudodonghicola flavimaris]MDK3017828.1 glycosyltransferase 61 family protein [Pseudodonghicola flavimaris]